MTSVRVVRVLWVVTLAALVACLAALPLAAAQATGAADGTIGIRIGDVADDPNQDPRARIYIVDHVPPGGTLTRDVTISNGTDQTQDVDVYAGPAEIDDGVFAVADKGVTSALSSWVDVGPSPVVIDSGQEAVVPVTITVPADAPEGEFYGVVWAAVATGTDSNGITSISRVGVRIYLSVGEGNGPPADFTISDLTAQRGPDGTAAVVAHVNNTGGRAVDLSGSLELTGGPGGLSAPTVESEVATVAPGSDGRVVFELPDSAALPDGPWTAQVQLASGFNSDAKSAQVSFLDGNVDTSDGSLPWPTILGVLAGVVILLAIAAAVVRRLARHRDGT